MVALGGVIVHQEFFSGFDIEAYQFVLDAFGVSLLVRWGKLPYFHFNENILVRKVFFCKNKGGTAHILVILYQYYEKIKCPGLTAMGFMAICLWEMRCLLQRQLRG